MKLLLIYADKMRYKTALKTLESEPDLDEEKSFVGVLVGFIHLEEADETDSSGVETKLVKNLKWAARKNGTKKIILHSFAHLAETKASPEFAKKTLDGAQERLIASGYEAYQTPFGYFLDLEITAPGKPSARIFKSF